jgi:hypothetical protein
LDESSQPYKDFSNNNQGSCIDENLDFCPEPVNGIIDKAQLFQGNQGLDVPGDSFNWGSADSFSIAFWMKKSDFPPVGFINNEVIVSREDRFYGKGLHWWVGVKNGDGAAVFILIDSSGFGSDGSSNLVSKKTLTDGEWHHVVAVRDAEQNINFLYVDGVIEDSVSITYPENFYSSFANLNIGYLTGNVNNIETQKFFYSGTVDDVRIYNVALSETEIEVLFQLRPKKSIPWLPIILLDDK